MKNFFAKIQNFYESLPLILQTMVIALLILFIGGSGIALFVIIMATLFDFSQGLGVLVSVFLFIWFIVYMVKLPS